MKILCVSDEELPGLWDYGTPEKLRQYDLIISCGDLKADYLSYLVTMARCPLLYVHGNHDGDYERKPPEGCDCIDGGIVTYNGLRIMGLGGCRKYRNAPHHYTDRRMRLRIARLWWKLRRLGGVDIVVSHVAPEELGDGEDYAHRGFAAFRDLLDRVNPGHWLFGHCHLYPGVERFRHYGGTTLINCCGSYVLELPGKPVKAGKQNQLVWITKQPHIDDEWDLP